MLKILFNKLVKLCSGEGHRSIGKSTTPHVLKILDDKVFVRKCLFKYLMLLLHQTLEVIDDLYFLHSFESNDVKNLFIVRAESFANKSNRYDTVANFPRKNVNICKNIDTVARCINLSL